MDNQSGNSTSVSSVKCINQLHAPPLHLGSTLTLSHSYIIELLNTVGWVIYQVATIKYSLVKVKLQMGNVFISDHFVRLEEVIFIEVTLQLSQDLLQTNTDSFKDFYHKISNTNKLQFSDLSESIIVEVPIIYFISSSYLICLFYAHILSPPRKLINIAV